MEPPVTKVNDCPLAFIVVSYILDFVIVLDVSLDINCVYMYFMISVNSLFIENVCMANLFYRIKVIRNNNNNDNNNNNNENNNNN